jgi:hypothetical protein
MGQQNHLEVRTQITRGLAFEICQGAHRALTQWWHLKPQLCVPMGKCPTFGAAIVAGKAS